MAEIRLERVTKRFGDVVALNEVDLQIEDGEFFCVLGPPGAGKTTLLRTIVGLERPSEGTVHVAGNDVTDVPPGERNISIVFQNLALYPDKSVYDNLAFPLRQQKPKPAKEEIDRRVRDAAAILRIEKLLARKPGQLSGGERQRVAIGRSLVRAPLVYLLDEPLSALDALLRLEMRAELKHLQRDLKRTLVYVTHDQVEAMSMSDRICVLNEGVVQQVAPPETVYNEPANTFVGRTVGTPPMNLLPLRVTAANGGLELRSDSFAVAGPGGDALAALAGRGGQLVQLGARAEDVRIGEQAGGSPLRSRVIAVEPLGGEVIVDLDVDGHIVKAMTPPGIRIEPDEVVPLGFDFGRVHVFDTEGDIVYRARGEAQLSIAGPTA
ncbi:MAG: ABC transporter ATP-binding protein [Thermoleophilia bacterium]|nr:ABC transporter ATP-binding protein [Thermoleophilia bacterium]